MKHPIFGKGMILAVEGAGDNQKITVVFQGNDDGGRRGVYSAQPASGGGGGTLKKLFDWQDKINEQTVFNIQMNFGSFDGVYVSFFIAWANTNEGIYSLSIF